MKPIIFSTPMVQAILDGRKTQTRRVIKNKDITNWFDVDVDGKPIAYIDQETGDSYPPTVRARYQAGDILWVRETWNYSPNWYYCYKADAIPDDNHGYIGSIPWKPSIFMPREAARLFLRVKNVRVERLQDITEEDAKAEGVICGQGQKRWTARSAFMDLWDRINGKKNPWESNPWVWVIEFEATNSGRQER